MWDESAIEVAYKAATHTVALNVYDNRIIVSSVELRGCQADWSDDRLPFVYGGQGVWG